MAKEQERNCQIKGATIKKRDDGLVGLSRHNPDKGEQIKDQSLLLRKNKEVPWKSFLTINANNKEQPIKVIAIISNNPAVAKKFSYNPDGKLRTPKHIILFHNMESLSENLITEARLPEKIDFPKTITSLAALIQDGEFDPEKYWQVLSQETTLQPIESE